jgi:hypothetical protein
MSFHRNIKDVEHESERFLEIGKQAGFEKGV